MTGPDFPSAAYDRWKTTPPAEKEVCERCECAVETKTCDCRCHWTDDDFEANAADERYDREKEG